MKHAVLGQRQGDRIALIQAVAAQVEHLAEIFKHELFLAMIMVQTKTE